LALQRAIDAKGTAFIADGGQVVAAM